MLEYIVICNETRNLEQSTNQQSFHYEQQQQQQHVTSPKTAESYSTKLSTSTLLKSSPSHFGSRPVRKFKIPLFYSKLLPTFLHTILQWILIPIPSLRPT